jgi:hypothetical protein
MSNTGKRNIPSRMWLYFTPVKNNRKFGWCNDVKLVHTDPCELPIIRKEHSTQALWHHLRIYHSNIAAEEDTIQEAG